MIIGDAFLDAIEDDMVRLSRRVYAETGVPMFLVPEDLRATAVPVDIDPKGDALATQFEAILAALESRNGPLSTSDIAHVIEVLADRYFLDRPFSSLGEGSA